LAQSKILAEIELLDPEADHQRICYLSTCFDFPWDTTRSLEFALYRTYCVPRMTALLVRTDQFGAHAQKRYDDTVLLLSELLERGYDSPRGRQAMRRINQLHGRFDISNEDFLYVLSTFVFEPIRWNKKFGWREMTQKERLAQFYYWREVGRRMNIRGIPETLEALEVFNVGYEYSHFVFNTTNHAIGVATREVFAGWFPVFLRPLVRRGIYALLDDPVLHALGLPKQPRWLTSFLESCLRTRARLLRLMPRRKNPRLLTETPHRTYPNGYLIDQLGPSELRHPKPGDPGPKHPV